MLAEKAHAPRAPAAPIQKKPTRRDRESADGLLHSPSCRNLRPPHHPWVPGDGAAGLGQFRTQLGLRWQSAAAAATPLSEWMPCGALPSSLESTLKRVCTICKTTAATPTTIPSRERRLSCHSDTPSAMFTGSAIFHLPWAILRSPATRRGNTPPRAALSHSSQNSFRLRSNSLCSLVAEFAKIPLPASIAATRWQTANAAILTQLQGKQRFGESTWETARSLVY
jgi:hypothetical protein